MYYKIGIDIGSTSAKTIVLDEDGQIVYRNVRPTGWSSVVTAEEIKRDLEKQGITSAQSTVVATGYGRVSVPFADKTVTEITCHAKGSRVIFEKDDLMIIDIGGQDTKAILLEDGMVKDFVMNDKCSAGTGRFLEVMANSLSVTPDALCEMAKESSKKEQHLSISSLCTVFAESEVISLIGRGEPREDIAYAIVDSIVKKVVTQASRLYNKEQTVCLTGGLCDTPYICEALAKELGSEVLTVPDARYAGAIGAASLAKR